MLAAVLITATLAPMPDPAAATETEQIRRVVAAVVVAGERNAARAKPARLAGDDLADHLIREAARTALRNGIQAKSFLVGLGIALDDTDLLRNNPLIRTFLQSIESDKERSHRLKVLGRPSFRGRRDWCLHFAVSAALTARFGGDLAERLGILKETRDARGTSGFSFADLAANYAGIAFATALLEKRINLAELAKQFRSSRFLLVKKDYKEGMPWKTFEKQYGGLDDKRFLDRKQAIRSRAFANPALGPR